jgi:hypothetical protein
MKLTQIESPITRNRLYIDEEKNRYPSSSTVAGKFWNKVGLYKWQHGLGQEEAERLGLDLEWTEIKALGRKLAEEIRDYSANRGTAIHDEIEHGTSTGNPEWDLFVEQYHKHIAPYLEIKHQEIALGFTSDKTVNYRGKKIVCRTAGKADLIGF